MSFTSAEPNPAPWIRPCCRHTTSFTSTAAAMLHAQRYFVTEHARIHCLVKVLLTWKDKQCPSVLCLICRLDSLSAFCSIEDEICRKRSQRIWWACSKERKSPSTLQRSHHRRHKGLQSSPLGHHKFASCNVVDVTKQECAGVGRALAQEFLRYGDSVIICSRDSERLRACSLSMRVMPSTSVCNSCWGCAATGDRVSRTIRELDEFSRMQGTGQITVGDRRLCGRHAAKIPQVPYMSCVG